MYDETIREDHLMSLHNGRLRIEDHIFEYKSQKGEVNLIGYVNPDLASKYPKVSSEVFSVTLRKSESYNEEVDHKYTVNRLIEICF